MVTQPQSSSQAHENERQLKLEVWKGSEVE